MKKQSILLFLFSFASIFSQEKRSNEISILSDNDLYTSGYQDRYYTNGLYLSYRYISKKKHKNSLKKVYTFELGHQMYTPFKSIVQNVDEHDRPFAGYLYGGFGFSNFYKNDLIVKFGARIGVIGPNSYSKEIMEVIHTFYGFNEVPGWDYQIASAFALNFDAMLVKNIKNLSWSNFDISWYNQVQAGTVFTNLSTGLYARIGLFSLTKLENSIAFHGNLNNKKQKTATKEAFFYIKPLIQLNAYDATIQGSFLNTNSPVTYGIKAVSFATSIGILFTLKNIHLGYAANLYTKRIKNPIVPANNIYGSIYLNYQLN